MGNAASGPAGGGAGGGTLALQQALLRGLADPALQPVLARLSAEPALTTAHKWDGAPLDPSKPDVAALVRLGFTADGGLQQRADREIAAGMPPSQFWSAYAAYVRHVLASAPPAAAATPTKAAASAPPPGAAATAAPSAPQSGEGDEDDDDGETLLWACDECFVYRVPPRPAASGWAAAAWGLDKPVLTDTYVRVTTGAGDVTVAVWQRPQDAAAAPGSGAKPKPAAATTPASAPRYSLATAPSLSGHKLVAACVIPASVRKRQLAAGGGRTQQPSPPLDASTDGPHLATYLEPVLDSSRYFVARIVGGPSAQARGSGPSASSQPPQPTGLLGLGFRDRDAAYALKASILDHLAYARRQAQLLVAPGDGTAPPQGAPSSAGALAPAAAGADPLAAAHAAALESALAGVSLGAAGGAATAAGGTPARVHVDVSVFGSGRKGGSTASAPPPASGAKAAGSAAASAAGGTPGRAAAPADGDGASSPAPVAKLLLPPPRKSVGVIAPPPPSAQQQPQSVPPSDATLDGGNAHAQAAAPATDAVAAPKEAGEADEWGDFT